MPSAARLSIAAQKKTLRLGMLIAAPVMLALWLALDRLLPPVRGMNAPLERLAFAGGCVCVAILLCFLTGIEAVAHQRLFSAAIDPLAGAETPAMKVDLRYLQHTLEQLMLFIPGLLGLAWYSGGGEGMRAVVATTTVWIVSRFLFWIGYHKGARYRSAGLAGMVQSMIVLLYVVYRFGESLGGPAAGAVPIALFLLVEGVLVYRAKAAVRA